MELENKNELEEQCEDEEQVYDDEDIQVPIAEVEVSEEMPQMRQIETV